MKHKISLALILSLTFSFVQAADWEVQFGSFKNESLAKQQIGRAKLIGVYNAQIKTVHHKDGGVYYRAVSSVANRHEADKVLQILRENKIEAIVMTP